MAKQEFEVRFMTEFPPEFLRAARELYLENDWIDVTSGKEFPPLATDEGAIRNSASLRLLHPFKAVNMSNQRIYTNIRVAMEKHLIEFPISYRAMQQLDAEEAR